jgi:hypothetical protein
LVEEPKFCLWCGWREEGDACSEEDGDEGDFYAVDQVGLKESAEEVSAAEEGDVFAGFGAEF